MRSSVAALPVAPLRLLWRGRREPGYREHVGERYGRYRGTVPPRILWVHAVSLGETRAAAPLVERLRRAYPDATLLLTHMTATGRATGRALFGDGVLQAWLPYDAPFAVRGFLAHFKPCAGLMMETELWPNLIALCRGRAQCARSPVAAAVVARARRPSRARGTRHRRRHRTRAPRRGARNANGVAVRRNRSSKLRRRSRRSVGAGPRRHRRRTDTGNRRADGG